MTLHINEVSIQMRVHDGPISQGGADGAVAQKAGGGDGGGDGAGDGDCGCKLSETQVEQIVATAVRRTLAALRTMTER